MWKILLALISELAAAILRFLSGVGGGEPNGTAPPVEPLEPATTKHMLTRCNLIAKGDGPGAYYAHIFRHIEDDTMLVVETTMEEYKGLAVDGVPSEIPAGYKWHCSFSDNRYDTPSGRLEEETFAEIDDEFLVLRDGKLVITSKNEPSPLLDEINSIK